VSHISSELDLLADFSEKVTHAALDHVVHGWVLGQNQTLKLVVRCVHRVAQSLLVEVSGPSAHTLDERLRCAQVPVHQTWRGVDVGIDRRLGQMTALVTGTAQTNDLNRLDCLNDFFDLCAEVRQGGSHLDFVVLGRLFHFERRKVLDVALDKLRWPEGLV